jgi:hypothetical protein
MESALRATLGLEDEIPLGLGVLGAVRVRMITPTDSVLILRY